METTGGWEEKAKKIDVPDRMSTIVEAGLKGISGHIGADYEFNLTYPETSNHYKKVKAAADELGLDVVDVVGSEFKTEGVREGSFTAEDAATREYAIENALRAAELATEWNVPTVRFWFGSDGKNGHFHRLDYDSIQRLQEGLLKVHEKFPNLKKSIEGKPGEPMGWQVLDMSEAYHPVFDWWQVPLALL